MPDISHRLNQFNFWKTNFFRTWNILFIKVTRPVFWLLIKDLEREDTGNDSSCSVFNILDLHNCNIYSYIFIMTQRTDDNKRRTADNSTYKKLAVLWLNEALCFVSSFVVADSFVLRNRQLLVAAKRYLSVGSLKVATPLRLHTCPALSGHSPTLPPTEKITRG